MPMAWNITATGQKAGSQACGTSSFATVTSRPTRRTRRSRRSRRPRSRARPSSRTLDSRRREESQGTNNSLKTYATSPIWSVVDGPWQFTHDGHDRQRDVRAEPALLGPGQADARRSSSSCRSRPTPPSSTRSRRQGRRRLPARRRTSPRPRRQTARAVSPERTTRGSPDYNLDPRYSWGDQLLPVQLQLDGERRPGRGRSSASSTSGRRSRCSSTSRSTSSKINKGYGVPTYGPVPVCPTNKFAEPRSQPSNPYPYNLSEGDQPPHGERLEGEAERDVTTCADAAKCGVPAGTPLSFTLQYAGGTHRSRPAHEGREVLVGAGRDQDQR